MIKVEEVKPEIKLEMPGADMKPMWDPELSHESYHADKTAVGSSSLRKILKSPKSFYSSFVLGRQVEETKPMKFGTLAHMAILEGDEFTRRYRVMPEFWGYTQKGEKTNSANCKEVKDAKAAWLMDQGPDAVICTLEERDNLFGMIESVLGHPDAFRLLKDGQTEVSGFYADPKTGIKCKIRPDFLAFDLGALVDIKTTVDCSINDFSKTIVNRGYHIQLGMYVEGASIISNKQIEYGTIIAIEKEPPYEIAVYVLDDAAMEIGELEYRRGLDRLKSCLESGKWGGYQDGIQNISLPHWEIQKYQIGGGL